MIEFEYENTALDEKIDELRRREAELRHAYANPDFPPDEIRRLEQDLLDERAKRDQLEATPAPTVVPDLPTADELRAQALQQAYFMTLEDKKGEIVGEINDAVDALSTDERLDYLHDQLVPAPEPAEEAPADPSLTQRIANWITGSSTPTT